MKSKNIIINIITVLSFICIAFCIVACIYLHQNLNAELTELTDSVKIMGRLVVVSLCFICLFHIILLIQALKRVDGTNKNSVCIVLIILSGLSILSDITILSNIVKEYRIWDVSSQWYMLYGFLAFHGLIMIAGALKIHKFNYSEVKIFNQIKNMNEIFYLSLHRISLICGVMGLTGIIVSVLSDITTDQHINSLVVVVSTLAIIPIIFNIIFWMIKFKSKKETQILDEKQLHDSALSALITLSLSIALYIIILVLKLTKVVSLSTIIWIFIIMFFQITIYNLAVVLKNR